VSTERLFDFPHPANDASPAPARFRRIETSRRPLFSLVRSRSARRAAFRTHPYNTTSPSHLSSISSALFQKSVHLIENKGKLTICKPFVFNQLRTLFHSSPGSPLFRVSSPKHTGGVPPLKSQELKCRLSSRDCHQVTPYPSATCKVCALIGGEARLCAPRDYANASRGRKKRKRQPRGKGRLFFVFALEHVPVRRSGPGVGV
jgi:hypothetical protein